MLSYVDRFIVKSRKKDVNASLLEEVKKYLTVEKTKIEEALRIEKLKAQANLKPSKKPKANKPEKDPYERHKIAIGSTVKLISTKQSGTVEAMDGDNITVTFGFLRMKVEKDKLMWVK
jgi:DNA mismatch repair protein MutS2